MSFDRPTLKELKDRIAGDFEGQTYEDKDGLTVVIAKLLRRSFIKILTIVWAGVSHSLHAFINWASRQIIPRTSDTENLEEHARPFGITRNPASAAGGFYVFTGVDTTIITAGTVLVRADEIQFTTTDDVTIGAFTPGEVQAIIVASTAGEVGNTDEGTKLTLFSPIPDVDAEGTVDTGGLTDGLPEENDENLLIRLEERIQEPPHGGALFDYIFFAKQVSGVTRVFPFGQLFGPGTVGVTFVTDDDDPIIPNPAKVQEVQDKIDEPQNAPVTANVTVFAPTELAVDFEIVLNPNTAEVQQAVNDELDQLFKQEGVPDTTIFRSHYNEAISRAQGEIDHTINLPVGNTVATEFDLPVKGTVTFV